MATTIEFDSDEALVLLEFALRFTETDELKIVHPAETIALWKLGGHLERLSSEIFDESYLEQLASARERLAVGYDPEGSS